MSRSYANLSELLLHSTDAEGFFAQLPDDIQAMAMVRSRDIHTGQDLRAFARGCQEGNQ